MRWRYFLSRRERKMIWGIFRDRQERMKREVEILKAENEILRRMVATVVNNILEEHRRRGGGPAVYERRSL
jgi:hypothetical protein